MIYKFVTPYNIYVPRKTLEPKKIAINLNVYRNLHRFTESKVKKIYCEDMGQQLEGLRIKTPIEISYQVFKPSKRRLDKMNIVAIASKYFLDALVHYNCIEDDNDDFIKTETILPTVYHKNNARIEIIVKEL